LWLVKNGVPFDVAFSLGNKERVAWSIIMSEHEGAKFNWETFNFVEPS
jgi:hypothetical protein